MRQKTFWIAASCVLAMLGLRPIFSSGAAPASTEKVIYAFTGGADGGEPMSNLTLDAAGNLYGTTSGGGTGACNSGCGTVFELKRTQDGWKEEVLHHFVGTDGESPGAGVIFDKAGNLYGTTTSGGSNGGGTVFKLERNWDGGWTESILYSFSYYGDGGSNPRADLVFDLQGNLYGTTSQGGSGGKSCSQNGCGTVFELTPQSNVSWIETTIHIFTDTNGDGATPSAGVVLDSAGNVYGATTYGGTGSCKAGGFLLGPTFGCGTTYKATRTSGGTWEESVPYSFARGGGFGVNPSSGLIVDRAGHMFGATSGGGDGIGAVFELADPQQSSWQQRILHRFYGNPDGKRPTGMLNMDEDGDLFGVTVDGGVNTVGTVFELEPSDTNDWRERVLHSFAGGTDGGSPEAGVVSDSQGHLYGTTTKGGSGTACDGGCGTVYEIAFNRQKG